MISFKTSFISISFMDFKLFSVCCTFLSLIVIAGCSTTRHPQGQHEGGGAYYNERPVYHGTVKKEFNLVHTQLNLIPDWAERYLHGTAYITVTPFGDRSDRLVLDARSMTISEVNLLNGDILTELGYDHRNDSLVIDLNRIYAPGDTLTVMVDYTSKPEEQEDEGGHAIRSTQGLFFINPDGSDPDKPMQIWTQGETRNNSVWFPTIDHPNQKMTQEIYLTVDTGFVTLSNGVLVSSLVNTSAGTRTDYWKQDMPHAPYLAMIVVGDYAVVKDTLNGMELGYYVEKEYMQYARDIFRYTPEMIDFYSDVFSTPYPWQKYSQVVVRDYVSGAMENTTAVVYGEFIQQDDREQHERNYDDVVAHELTHHWFGDLVTCESWSNIVLNEGFATYGEYLWFEYKNGRDHADHMFNKDLESYLRESQVKQKSLVRYDYDKDDDLYDRHSYQKGGRILHMLRKYTGDEKFFASCSLYLARNSFGTVEAHDLRLAFEDVTGEDLNWFFDQWFFEPGHPILNVSYEFVPDDLLVIVKVSQQQDLRSSPVYKLPLEIDIYDENGSVTRHQVVIDSIRQTIKLSCTGEPLLVNFDSEKMLLCEKHEYKSADEWVYQYGHAPLFMDRWEALYELGKLQGEVMYHTFLAALKDPSPAIRKYVAENMDDLLKEDRDPFLSELCAALANEHDPGVKATILEELIGDSHPRHPQIVIDAVSRLTDDRSYEVQMLAYQYLIERDSDEWLNEVSKMESDLNYRIRGTVFLLYAQYGTDEQYEFMEAFIDGQSGADVYGSAEQFGIFLLNCKPDKAMKGVEVLGEIGLQESSWLGRLGAFRGLERIVSSYGTQLLQTSGPELERNSTLVNNVKKKAIEYIDRMKAREEDPLLKKTFNR
jgi:aminopeptidase N